MRLSTVPGSARRLALYLVVLAQAALGCYHANSTYEGASAPGGLVGGIISSVDIGELAYEIAAGRLDAPEAAALAARKADFVAAVNAVIDAQAVAGLGPTLDGILGLVRDDTLPKMAENVAQILDALANEPGRPTLQAFVALAGTRGVLQTDDAVAFASRLVNYPEIADLFTAVAGAIAQNGGAGGRPDLVREAETLLARALRSAAQPPAPAAPPGLFDGLGADLLDVVALRGGASFGAPAYAARVDLHGNPAVAVDPATGTLYAPFVDRDGDGAADVDADGDPVDAGGAAIAIPAFGASGAAGRDANGFALAADGRPLYVYFDAKTMLMSHFLALFGEGLRRGIHDELLDALVAALGPRASNGTWSAFAPDEPLLDLSWGGLELLKTPELPALCRALADLQRTDPAMSEELLVTYGRIVEQVRAIPTATATPTATPPSYATSDELVTIFDQVFNGPSSPSAGRVLLDVLHELGATARQLPPQLALLMRYRTLVLDPQGAPIPGQSELVDFTRPPTRSGSPGGENRSILEQLLDMFAEADACSTFVFAGKPLSQSLLDLMADFSAGTLSGLIGFIDNPIVQLYVSLACPAMQDSLESLKGLAASGALAGFVPIAKVFVDQSQEALFVRILTTIDGSYDAVRAVEPSVASILASGAIDAVFDLDDLLVAGVGGQPIVDPLTGAPAVDILAAAVGRLLAHPAGGVPDRTGAAQPTLLHLVLSPARRLEAEPGASAALSALYFSITDLFVERISDTELRNPSLTPFLAHALDALARNLPFDDGQRAAALAADQQSALDALQSEWAAQVVDLATALRATAGGDAIRDAVEHLLTPDPNAAADAYGSLMKVLAGALQLHVDTAPLRPIAAFAADLVDPANARIVDLVTGASALLAADQGKMLISLLRNALDAPPAAAGLGTRAPITVLISVIEDIRAAGAATPPAADPVERAADELEAAVAFIRDPQGGLARVWAVLKSL